MGEQLPAIVENTTTVLTLDDAEAKLLRELGKRLAKPDPMATTGLAEPVVDGDPDDETLEEETRRSVVRVTRAKDAGTWSVRVSNLVGVIGLNGRTLVVNPKIPLRHFAHLALADVGDVRHDQAAADQGEGVQFVELLANWFLAGTEDLLHSELLRDYREVVSAGPYVRGSLLFRPTVMNLLRGRAEVTSRHDEFDRDIPANRVLLEAARRLSGHRHLVSQTRLRSSRVQLRFDGVGRFQRSDLGVRPDRRMARYRVPHRLGTDIIRSTIRDLSAGDASSQTFLIYTPSLIESGVRAMLKRNFPHLVVHKSAIPLAGGDRSMHPDIVIGDNEVTGDVKYRKTSHTARAPWRRAELNQAVAFAAAARASRGFIVGFVDREDEREPELRVGDIAVRRFDWPVDDVEPEESEDLFVSAFGTWLARHSETQTDDPD